MNLTYSERGDVAFVEVAGPIPAGGVDFTEEVDRDRNVKYDAEARIIGYEFLNVRRFGVRLDDLEHRDELRRLFREAGFAERDWGTPRPAPTPRARTSAT